MEFADAVAQLEARFGKMADKGFDPPDVVHIASGGVIERLIDEAPALTVERGQAIKLWFDAAFAALVERKPKAWRFLEGPHADKWRITIQDEMCTHRIAADRYSVVCSIGLAGKA